MFGLPLRVGSLLAAMVLVGVMGGTSLAQQTPMNDRGLPPAVDAILDRFGGSDDLIGLAAVVLIFGGLTIVGALFGLAAIVRAVRGDSVAMDELNERLASIESKLESLAPRSG